MKRLMIAALVLGAALAAYLPGTARADDDKLEVKINGRMPTVTVPTADGPVKIMRNQDLIAVAAPFRRQGIAGQMIEAAFDQFGETIDGIRVGTQEDNLASIRLYERAGFAVERRDVTLHWVNSQVTP